MQRPKSRILIILTPAIEFLCRLHVLRVRSKTIPRGASMQDDFVEGIIAILPNLQRYALSLCRRADLADDLVQLAAEKAFRSRDTYDPSQRLDVWMLRIVRNTWIDEIRRTRTRGTEINVQEKPDILHAPAPHAAEVRLELSATLAAIYALPDAQRDVMILVCVEELTYREAAEILDVPVGTVMSRLARARRALAESLGIGEPDSA